jgi:hypothetical protein
MINHHLRTKKIWDRVIKANVSTELTEKQMYAQWAELNEEQWCLDDD